MPLTKDRFKKIFTKKVSDDLLNNRIQKVDAAITELKDNITALEKKGIECSTYKSYVPELEKAKTDATKTGTTEEKYKALEQVKLKARQYADNALKAADIEPSDEDINKLKAVLAEKDGTKKLDKMISGLSGKADTPAKKKLVIAAIKARWGLEKLNGDLSSNALPRLYSLMSKIPEDHIKGNDKLKEIRRDKNPPPGETSFYRGEEDLIVLNLDKSTGLGAGIVFGKGPEGLPRIANYFDHTTLHEIGHAVDEKIHFMDSKGKNAENGEWRQESIESVAMAGGAGKGFFAAFKQFPPTLLGKFLEQVLKDNKTDPMPELFVRPKQVADSGVTKEELLADAGGKKAEEVLTGYLANGWPDALTASGVSADTSNLTKLRGVKRMAFINVLDRAFAKKTTFSAACDTYLAELPKSVPTDDDWKRMARHAAVEWCRQVRMKSGSSGLWDGGASAAGKVSVGGTVYEQSYEDEWWSYSDARPGELSTYQFRGPAEWFAEQYAAYYLDWLPKNHWIGKLDMTPAT